MILSQIGVYPNILFAVAAYFTKTKSNHRRRYIQMQFGNEDSLLVILNRLTMKEWNGFIKFLTITKRKRDLPYAGFIFHDKGKLDRNVIYGCFWTAKTEKGWIEKDGTVFEKKNFKPSENYQKVGKTFLTDKISIEQGRDYVVIPREFFIKTSKCCFKADRKLKELKKI